MVKSPRDGSHEPNSFWLKDIPEKNPNAFTFENSILRDRVMLVVYWDSANRVNRILDGWSVIATCSDVPSPVSLPGHIGIMAFHNGHGEMWQHYPRNLAKKYRFVGSLLT